MPSGCSGLPTGEILTAGDGLNPWVSITYDEHLGANTIRALRYFAMFGMHGTFFTVGREVVQRPGIARAILAYGHEIGNHSWDHSNLTEKSDNGLAQMLLMNVRTQQITGFSPCTFRPPYGAINAGVLAAAASLGLATVKWGPSPPIYDNEPRRIAQTALDQVSAGSIVLLHQTDWDVSALPSLLSGLRSKGLTSVPVVQLLGGAMA